MPLNHEKLMAWTGTREVTPEPDACILYALGVGLGADPTDRRQLAYLDERALAALPTMAMVLGVPPAYLRDPEIGVDMLRMVHGESGLVLHRPIPVGTRLRATQRIDAVLDRGPEKGAATYFSTEIVEADGGAPVATTSGCFVMRGNGGFGGPSGPAPQPHQVPDRAPDRVVDLPTLPQAGMIYRLSGDRNPLHIDPDIARKAGFDRPILHGLAAFGVAGHAVLAALCDYDAGRFRALQLRYAAPVYPGETLRFEIFHRGDGRHSLRARALERDRVVLQNGYAEVAA